MSMYEMSSNPLRDKLQVFSRKNYGFPFYQETLTKQLVDLDAADAGNAIRLASRFGLDFHYVLDWGCWLHWDGSRWVKDEGGIEVMAAAKSMADYIRQESRETEDDKQAISLRKWALTSESLSRLQAAIELLKSEPGIALASAELDANDNLIHFPNGTLDLISMDMREARREDLITKSAGVLYDPAARCLEWERFMIKVTCARPDLLRYIRAVAGSGLFGSILDQILVIFHGVGGNGKSVWVEVVKEAMGDYAATATADLFTAKQSEGISNDIARLVGVRFLSASETAEGRFLDEALVKGLTGGERRTARFLRQEFFEFSPKFTPVLLTNYPPVIRGTDSGIWRRLKLIPWDYDFMTDPQREDTLTVMSRFRAEGSGIMNWLITGLQDRLSLKSLDQIEPEVVRSATQRYREDSDILGQFLAEQVLIDINANMAKEELYQAYVSHAKDSGNNPMSKRTLSTKLQLRGWKDRRSTGGKQIWLSRRLRLETDQDQAEADTSRTAPEPQNNVVQISSHERWEVIQ